MLVHARSLLILIARRARNGLRTKIHPGDKTMKSIRPYASEDEVKGRQDGLVLPDDMIDRFVLALTRRLLQLVKRAAQVCQRQDVPPLLDDLDHPRVTEFFDARFDRAIGDPELFDELVVLNGSVGA